MQFSFGSVHLCSPNHCTWHFNGTPYDANLLLESAGPFAWIMIGIEIVVWGFLALVIGGKVVNRIQVPTQEIASSEQITPQA